jgi:AAA domain, putative AbiEii toxin, Type IV TA system
MIAAFAPLCISNRTGDNPAPPNISIGRYSPMRITVKKFGVIKDVDLEIKPLTVLVGPQAAGKSLLAKLVFLGRSLAFDFVMGTPLVPWHGDRISSEQLQAKAGKMFERYFPAGGWGPNKFKIQMDFGYLALSFSPKASEQVGVVATGSIFSIGSERLGSIRNARAFPMELIEINSPEYFYFPIDPTFFPAERSGFSSISNLIWELLKRQQPIDPFLVEFGALFQRSVSRQTSFDFDNQSGVADVIGGSLIQRDEQMFVRFKDKRELPVANLSSGQQALLPLLVILGLKSELDEYEGQAFFVEEPETHLFPQTQAALIEYLVASAISTEHKRSLFLTTHSPYVLSTINNMLLAGQLDAAGRKTAKSKLKTSSLTPDQVSIHAMHDGIIESLMDEDGLIDVSYIDQISGDLAKTFDQLYALKERAHARSKK